MSIILPAVYDGSWKLSVVTSYIASVAALMTSAPLTGGIYRGMVEPNLGRN